MKKIMFACLFFALCSTNISAGPPKIRGGSPQINTIVGGWYSPTGPSAACATKLTNGGRSSLSLSAPVSGTSFGFAVGPVEIQKRVAKAFQNQFRHTAASDSSTGIHLIFKVKIWTIINPYSLPDVPSALYSGQTSIGYHVQKRLQYEDPTLPLGSDQDPCDPSKNSSAWIMPALDIDLLMVGVYAEQGTFYDSLWGGVATSNSIAAFFNYPGGAVGYGLVYELPPP